jgi:SAM-dependent methyltransferase
MNKTEPMGDMPTLFDQRALHSNMARANAAGHLPGFLDEIIAEELTDKFASISRSFTNIAIIAHDPTPIAAALNASASAEASITHVSPLASVGLFLDNPDLPGGNLDCIFVVGGLEWVNDLPGSLNRLRRALKPDGVLLAAMLGGETLNELRSSWLHAETMITGGASPRVAPFCDVRDAGGLLQRAGFALPVVDTDRLNVRYDNALALMSELKILGMANAMTERSRSLSSPSLLAAACAHYDENYHDPDGRVRATFQMVYLTGWSPDESQPKPLRPGSARVRLADALNVGERKLPRE